MTRGRGLCVTSWLPGAKSRTSIAMTSSLKVTVVAPARDRSRRHGHRWAADGARQHRSAEVSDSERHGSNFVPASQPAAISGVQSLHRS